MFFIAAIVGVSSVCSSILGISRFVGEISVWGQIIGNFIFCWGDIFGCYIWGVMSREVKSQENSIFVRPISPCS